MMLMGRKQTKDASSGESDLKIGSLNLNYTLEIKRGESHNIITLNSCNL